MPPAAFDRWAASSKAVHDLRLVCRELARVVARPHGPSRSIQSGWWIRDRLESERNQLKDLAARYSQEDLMLAFDVLSRAEFEIRGSAQPRYPPREALVR